METVSKIRRWVLADGLSIRGVSRRTGISRSRRDQGLIQWINSPRTTVRKYLRDEEVEPRYRQRGTRPLRSLLDYELRLKALYEADLGCAPRERRSLQGFAPVHEVANCPVDSLRQERAKLWMRLLFVKVIKGLTIAFGVTFCV